LDIEIDGNELFDLFQVTYNIFDQDLALIAEGLSKRNKQLIIKEALANGRIFPNPNYPNYAKAYKHLKQLSLKYNVGIDAIALRYCMDSIPSHKVLSGAATEFHLLENMKTSNFKLTDQDIAILNKLAVKATDYWNERKQLGWN